MARATLKDVAQEAGVSFGYSILYLEWETLDL